jgi:hypothetical protein
VRHVNAKSFPKSPPTQLNVNQAAAVWWVHFAARNQAVGQAVFENLCRVLTAAAPTACVQVQPEHVKGTTNSCNTPTRLAICIQNLNDRLGLIKPCLAGPEEWALHLQ